MMESDLRNMLKSVCTNTTWKYAIFWKLKSLPTPVLTSEDVYYENSVPFDSLGYGSFGDSKRDHSQSDQLGLWVARMSCQVYSLGEGIVGKAVATGEYQWIHAKSLQRNSSHWIEHSNILLGQISAGIRTVVVVGIAQFAAVQLGSMYTVDEDVTFVSLLRDAFLSLSECGSTLQSSCVPMGRDYVANKFDKPVPMLPQFCDRRKIPNSSYDTCISQNQLNMEIVYKIPESDIICANEGDLKAAQQSLQSGTVTSCYAPNSNLMIDFEDSNDNLRVVESTSPTSKANKSAIEAGSSSMIAHSIDYEQDSLTIFSAGYELHEALGPAFMRRYVFGSEHKNAESVVVSNACQSDVLSEKSVSPVLCESSRKEGGSLIALNSILKEDKQEWSNSTEACGASTYSTFTEAVKMKKRARSGENSRQRPRDRQLIQDRIKELREIVPNGSKCSIDSLLELTINHMLFLESITKHAEKLKRCAESRKNEKVRNSQSYEQGSSWAVEVGGHFKVSSVLVENLNKSGQMLVEMVCEECTHFLEISQVIKGLGLTILKGVTEGQGGKTWLCFVVEWQNNQTMLRRDVLCSLLQALQSKPSL